MRRPVSPDLELPMVMSRRARRRRSSSRRGCRRLGALLRRHAGRPGRLGRLDADVAAGVVAGQEVAATWRGALHLHAAAAKASAAF